MTNIKYVHNYVLGIHTYAYKYIFRGTLKESRCSFSFLLICAHKGIQSLLFWYICIQYIYVMDTSSPAVYVHGSQSKVQLADLHLFWRSQVNILVSSTIVYLSHIDTYSPQRSVQLADLGISLSQNLLTTMFHRKINTDKYLFMTCTHIYFVPIPYNNTQPLKSLTASNGGHIARTVMMSLFADISRGN